MVSRSVSSVPSWCPGRSHLFPHGVQVVFEVAVFAQDGGPLAALVVTEPVTVVQLRLQGAAQLLQLRDLRFGLLRLQYIHGSEGEREGHSTR